MKYLSRPFIGLILLTACVACQEKSKSEELVRDEKSMVLSDDRLPAKPFVAGVGDTLARLVERNPYLASLDFNGRDSLHLPLLSKLDAAYDDGDIKLAIGCVMTSNVDGNEHLSRGVASIGFVLCNPAINDWKVATQRAAALIADFEEKNPNAINLREFWETAPESERKRIGGHSLLMKSGADYKTLRTIDEADDYFAALASEGHKKELKYHGGSNAFVGIYLGKKAIFRIGISKDSKYGGDNLTDEQRKTMKYQVTMGFYLRNDAELP